MKDLKYLLAYIAPALATLGLLWGGYWSYGAVLYAFVFLPLTEPLLPKSRKNFTEEEKQSRLKDKFFDALLYFNLPILYALVIGYFFWLAQDSWQLWELIGNTLSVGLIISASGINVGHELGHRREKFEQNLSKLHLLPALYMHFFVEHNRGHHKYVATPLDPASADKGENLYFFWVKSLVGGYLNAWKLEKDRLEKRGLPMLSWHNLMVRFQVYQLAYLGIILAAFGPFVALMAIVVGLNGALLLETVNYIEHYGLRREKLPSGKYERVMPRHSWNANYELGRIMLYELTRHSDHHYMASKKFQILDHHEEAPEMPFGYPSAMILAHFPPLWFYVMDRKIQQYEQSMVALG